MDKRWDDKAWEEYVAWNKEDNKTFNKINALIKDIESSGVGKGIGKPEKLRYRDGWSRRIDDENRIVYVVEDESIYIISCREHY